MKLNYEYHGHKSRTYTPVVACIADDKNLYIQYVWRPKRKANKSLTGMYVAKAEIKMQLPTFSSIRLCAGNKNSFDGSIDRIISP